MLINREKIPDFVTKLSERLLQNGYQAFIVGGAVRDSLLGSQVKDWDIATDATPDKIQILFRDMTNFNLKHGTVSIVFKRKNFEVTTFKGRKGFGSDIEEDLAHRDFTFNAMAFDICNNRLLDPFEGKQDIKRKIVRAVECPSERFIEDPLRMIRAIRFSLEFGYALEADTFKAIKSMSVYIERVANERIRDELLRILMTKRPSRGFTLMRKTGLLHKVLPELLEGYMKRQNSYHKFTIYRHIMETVDSIQAEQTLRISALLHDIAKPRVREKVSGTWRFYNHASESAELALEILYRLKFSNEEINKVTNLIAHHMFDYKKDMSDRAVRRFIKRAGKENINELINLREADDFAHGWGSDFEKELKAFKARVEAISKESPALGIHDLAVDGYDIMGELSLKPGPMVGQILEKLLDMVIETPSYNKKEKLIAIIKSMGDKCIV